MYTSVNNILCKYSPSRFRRTLPSTACSPGRDGRRTARRRAGWPCRPPRNRTGGTVYRVQYWGPYPYPWPRHGGWCRVPCASAAVCNDASAGGSCVGSAPCLKREARWGFRWILKSCPPISDGSCSSRFPLLCICPLLHSLARLPIGPWPPPAC